jgi:hypothetical protein
MARKKKKDMEKICVCFFHLIYKLSETVLILKPFEQDITKTAQTSPCKLPAILITL